MKSSDQRWSILAAQRLNWALWLVGSRHFCSRTDEGQGNRNPPSPRTERYPAQANSAVQVGRWRTVGMDRRAGLRLQRGTDPRGCGDAMGTFRMSGEWMSFVVATPERGLDCAPKFARPRWPLRESQR
jgi:hypothetical protein